MKHTLYEKIIQTHLSDKDINIGDIVEVDVDRVMIHDFFSPYCINKFDEMGFDDIYDTDKVVIVYDHLVPACFIDDNRHHSITEAFIKKHNLKHVHRSDGVCHQLLHEQGYVKPGDIVLGTDSHTVTYGALGLIATGIGYTEMPSVLGTGKIWLKVVPTIKIEVNGELHPGTYYSLG